MNKLLFTTLCFILLVTTPSVAQKKKNAAPKPTVEELMQKYLFDDAEKLLEQEIDKLKRRRKPVIEQKTKLEEINRLRSAMEATERVIIIDSMVVNKHNFLNHIRLSAESGEILSTNDFFDNRQDTCGCTVYKPEVGERIWFAKPDEAGLPKLHYSDYEDYDWLNHKKIEELNNDSIQNYPFILSDGLTLYYAAQGLESLGGYDIFVTRYDTDENKYLQPENIGMPFNSPANDYMMAIDEYNQLGWFVSDRHQPKDKVCIYVFIPNTIKKTYNPHLYSQKELGSLARIESIADTWSDKQMVAEGKERLDAVRNSKESNKTGKAFEFVINDRYTYTSLSDFKSDAAIKMMQTWLKDKKEHEKNVKILNALRSSYSISNPAQQQTMSQELIDLETKNEMESARLKQGEKEIRRLEIEYNNY